MTKFEDNLLDDLLAAHGPALADAERPPVRHSASRQVGVAAGALVVAGAIAAGVTVFGHSPPAYAVTKNPDGTVTVSINDIKAVGPANEKLQEFGIRARAVPVTKDCPSITGQQMGSGARVGAWLPVENADGSVTLKDSIPVGYTVLLVVSPYPGRGTGLGFTGPVKDPAPSCYLDPADDPTLRGGN